MIDFVNGHGNENVRAGLRALAAGGLLARFHTSIATPRQLCELRLLPEQLREELSRRRYDGIPFSSIRLHPWREAVRVVVQKLGIESLTRHETGWASFDRVYGALDVSVAALVRSGRSQGRAVYCYEDGALATFRAARERGLRCIYHLPIPYWRLLQRILHEEGEREPEWAATIPALYDSAAKLQRKDEELALADDIIVASSFTRASLCEAPRCTADIHVVRYGAPPPSAAPKPKGLASRLRVLFVGKLEQRKGIAYLFRAIGPLSKAVELTVIGARVPGECRALDEALGRHTWLPRVGHGRLLDMMENYDVLVFPSLVEGFGVVILEAMSRGLTVITTRHTGGPDVIDHDLDGFIIPIRDSEAIAAHLVRLNADRPLLRAMSEQARRKAGCLLWSVYERNLLRVAHAILSDRGR